MPFIDLSILNQRQTPAFYADVFANRPAAGFVGRIFVSTDTYAFYRDNGTGWDLIGGPGTGTVTGTGANGQVTFWNGASTITGSNDLFWDATNGHLGVNTNAPGTALDVHHDQPTVAILNQTVATNDVRIGFQNNGVGLWRIGAFYNAGANDFGIFDAVGNIQPVTVKKTTGQVLIGTSTVGSGKLVVASASSDNGIQIVGASAPSLRIDNAESGPTKRAGFGISTATNNFIQGSADRDFCMFNGSTTASPILFGIYDAAAVNVQEAARISAARNFLIGTTTDNGSKLQVNGTSTFSNSVSIINQSLILSNNWYITARNAANTLNLALIGRNTSDRVIIDPDGYGTNIGGGGTVLFNPTGGNVGIGTSTPNRNTEIISSGGAVLGVSSSSNGAGILYGRIAMYTNFGSNSYIDYGGEIRSYSGAGIDNSDLRFYTANGAPSVERMRITNGGNVGIGTSTPGRKLEVYSATSDTRIAITNSISGSGAALGFELLVNNADAYAINYLSGNLILGTTSAERMRITSSGNLLIGTTTDAGQKLQVNGTSLFSGNVTINASGNPTLTISGSGAYTGQLIINAGGGGSSVIQANGGSNKLIIAPNNVAKLTIGTTTINITSIPTSAAGLSSGDVYSNAGILTIVP